LTRSGTTNWANDAGLNGDDSGAGPGVIQPPVTLTFNTGGPYLLNLFNPGALSDGLSRSTAYPVVSWGSFDGSTNAPFMYPDVQVAFQPSPVHFRLLLGGGTNDFSWPLAGQAYGRFYFQTATNFTAWTTLATLTNSGAPFSFEFQGATNEAMRLFRTVQQR